MYGPPPPEYPRATNSPTIILLASGLTGMLGFLIGFFAGMGSGEPPARTSQAPSITVTIKDSAPPGTDPAAPATTAQPPATEPTGAQPTGAQPTASAPVGSLPPSGLSGMRVLVVGRDIQPGTYRTTGPLAGQQMCYWARMRSESVQVSDVIAAGMPNGPASVTILATDKAFQTGGCAEWTKA